MKDIHSAITDFFQLKLEQEKNPESSTEESQGYDSQYVPAKEPMELLDLSTQWKKTSEELPRLDACGDSELILFITEPTEYGFSLGYWSARCGFEKYHGGFLKNSEVKYWMYIPPRPKDE